jgi:hypothetical protein
MNFIYQPLFSFLCGQACIAMILNLTLTEAIQKVGHDHSMTDKEIQSFLHLTPQPIQNTSDKYLLKIQYKTIPHWVLLIDNQIYDPLLGIRENTNIAIIRSYKIN